MSDILNSIESGSIIGINGNLEVFRGYDMPLREANAKNDTTSEFDVKPTELLSIQERSEIADKMIARWQEYKRELT